MVWILLVGILCMLGIVAAMIFTTASGHRTAASRQDNGIEG